MARIIDNSQRLSISFAPLPRVKGTRSCVVTVVVVDRVKLIDLLDCKLDIRITYHLINTYVLILEDESKLYKMNSKICATLLFI